MARSSLGPGLDGILVIAKPAGPTSHDVVALVRATGVREIHASASEAVQEVASHVAKIGQTTRVTRQEIVRAMVQALRESQTA